MALPGEPPKIAFFRPGKLTLLKLPRRPFVGFLIVALASCVSPRSSTTGPPQPPPTPSPAVEPATAIEAGVRPGPDLALDPAAATRALQAFRISCPSLLTRQDASGLTQAEDWRPACTDADAIVTDWTSQSDILFFRRHFETIEVGDANAFATGYYEPEIRGSRTRQAGYEVPVYATPPDLLEINPATGARGRGRVDESGAYVLYHDRAAIDGGVLAGRGLEIGWAADPVDLFFLQIQGSGRLRLPDGGVMRIGYAGQNGREYIAIGRILRDRGLIEAPVTMQKIVDWLRVHSDEGRAVMQENRSYIFFRELTGPGPLGALGRPVTPEVSVAADPRFVPLGAPVLLSNMDNPRANGLWIAQDTGGAIRGANRFDTFWGAGATAAATAGTMQSRGRALLLLPRGAIERIRARAATER